MFDSFNIMVLHGDATIDFPHYSVNIQYFFSIENGGIPCCGSMCEVRSAVCFDGPAKPEGKKQKNTFK